MSDKVSVIIPSCQEVFLPQTINDVLGKAFGEVECIVALDGYEPDPPLPERKNLILLHLPRGGMRASINAAAKVATGKWLMKTDAHCMYSEGYDEVLKTHCQEDWIMIPRRFSLDVEHWAIEHNGKPPRDYHYLCYPLKGKDHDDGMHGIEWWERGKQRRDPQYDIDETMSFQGSCWFMTHSWFTDFLGGMNEAQYGWFAQEPQEIGLKTWLGGGKVMTNKLCWYAHLHKGKRYGRMYHINQSEIIKAHNFSAEYWMNNRWEQRVHNIDWFISRFWPVPGWPDDWQTVWYQ